MNYQNPKTQTTKIPRQAIRPRDQENMLDVFLACAYPGVEAASSCERASFESHIMHSPNSEMCQKLKDALANLTEEEKRLLFH